jgi:hypothetical protein
MRKLGIEDVEGMIEETEKERQKTKDESMKPGKATVAGDSDA